MDASRTYGDMILAATKQLKFLPPQVKRAELPRTIHSRSPNLRRPAPLQRNSRSPAQRARRLGGRGNNGGDPFRLPFSEASGHPSCDRFCSRLHPKKTSPFRQFRVFDPTPALRIVALILFWTSVVFSEFWIVRMIREINLAEGKCGRLPFLLLFNGS